MKNHLKSIFIAKMLSIKNYACNMKWIFSNDEIKRSIILIEFHFMCEKFEIVCLLVGCWDKANCPHVGLEPMGYCSLWGSFN